MLSADSVVKKSYSKIPVTMPLPNLVEVQLNSFRSFQEEGLQALLEEFSPVEDFTGTRFELSFLGYEFRKPKHSEAECQEQDLTYAAPLYVKVRLLVKETGEVKESDIYMGEFPLMTQNGVFIINGAERVVVSQLIRSPGVYFTLEKDVSTGRELCFAKLIPEHGAWLEFETSSRDVLSVKVDGKRRIPVTTFLRSIGYGTDEDLNALFEEVDNSSEHSFIQSTIAKKPEVKSQRDALLDIYGQLRPGDPANEDNAREWLKSLFFSARRYDLGKVGRYKLNKRLWRELLCFGFRSNEKLAAEILVAGRRISGEQWKKMPAEELRGIWKSLPQPEVNKLVSRIPQEEAERLVAAHYNKRVLSGEDLAAIVYHMILVNNGQESKDDIDHLGNRRLRTVGELIQNQLRIGFMRLERMIKERMSIIEQDKPLVPSALINPRPLAAAIREFFGGSQLSQFMDQTNPLAELTHKRRLSALGPGGLSRERAGFEVRDVHHSHYGRICPIETPEGPNIGLLSSLATYSKVNEFGLIETPYRRVLREVTIDPQELEGKPAPNTFINAQGNSLVEKGKPIAPELARLLVTLELQGRMPLETSSDARGRVLAEKGKRITPEIAQSLIASSSERRRRPRPIKVVPFVSHRIVYFTADREEQHLITQANARLNEYSEFIGERIEVRQGDRFFREIPDKIEFMDVSPKQIVSVATALIPFLEHDDANRALMGSNMQRQAVPLLRPETPLVGTGMERPAAQYSGQLAMARSAGEVVSVTGREIKVREDAGEERVYPLMKFVRTNQGTCINQRPIVSKGQRVEEGQVLADSSATDHGELALGQNVRCAFMSWEGYNFEDAIIVSESLLREDKFTSIHVERYKAESRETKLGEEEITRDIPNVGEESLRDLDEQGIIRAGAEVESGDILVGKITPKGETEMTAEEKLLRAIFGEKARDVKDTSLRLPHGERGTVTEVRIFSDRAHAELPVGVKRSVRVWVAQKRKLSVGDKLAGRHGNKGVVSRVLPLEDMPFLPDGTPVEIILNPIGVPSRMNIGLVLEAHLGWAAKKLSFEGLSPVFDGASNIDIEDAFARVWLAQNAGAIKVVPGEKESTLDWERVSSLLRDRGYEAERLFSESYAGEARKACLRLWLEELGQDVAGLEEKELTTLAEKVAREKSISTPLEGKTILRDGLTGEPFHQPVTVGYIYMMKLIHLVEDKVHARSTGPYSLITQQPLGGKAQFGGQRFGEMEVWALEAYGAAHILQELLTIKSDDVSGRAKAYEAIIKGEKIQAPGLPESFKVLYQELRSLGLAVEVLSGGEGVEPVEERLLNASNAED